MTDHFICVGALDLVESIAAGDLEVDAAVREHFESCPRCAAALASARRIERGLAARSTAAAPVRFTQAVLGRIRRERWRSEQQVDRLFNIAIVAALVVMAAAAAAFLNVGTVLSLGASGWAALGTLVRRSTENAVPILGTYVASIGLFVSALLTWWWAERRLSL